MFKGKQYQKEIILLTVRWYLKYPLSYRNLAEMMEERGLAVRHTTLCDGYISMSQLLIQ